MITSGHLKLEAGAQSRSACRQCHQVLLWLGASRPRSGLPLGSRDVSPLLPERAKFVADVSPASCWPRTGSGQACGHTESLQPPSSEPRQLWPQHCHEANPDCLEAAARSLLCPEVPAFWGTCDVTHHIFKCSHDFSTDILLCVPYRCSL